MIMVKVDNRKDFLLLLLYSPGVGFEFNEPIVGRTRLVKMVFLFLREALAHFKKGTEITEENFYQFFPWKFGPFSVQIYDDLNFFLLREFVRTSTSSEDPFPESVEEWVEWLNRAGIDDANSVHEYEEVEFSLTQAGEQFAEELYQTLSSSQKRLIKEFKARFSSTALPAILRYVYEKYPEMTTESEIRQNVRRG